MKQNAPYLHQVTGTQRYKQNNELPFGQDSDKHIQGLRRQYVQFVSPTLQNGELAKQLLFTKKDGKGNAEKCVGTTEKHILLNTVSSIIQNNTFLFRGACSAHLLHSPSQVAFPFR